MSVQKRPHDEGSHSSSSSKHPHDDPGGAYSNPNPTIPLETGQDARATKIARSESRDMDRRSPLHSMYRLQSSSPVSDAHFHATHSATAGSVIRMDSSALRDVKDSRDIKGEQRDSKTDSREIYRPATKVDKDGRLDGWGNVGSSSVAPSEPAKEGPRHVDREENVEGNEAVGENKVDWRSDDRYKDKDRKRKEGKHRDWGDRDKDRSDRVGTNMQNRSSIEHKDLIKEEKESDRGAREKEREREREREKERERERRDAHKEKERAKEKEKENLNKEVEIAAEKEVPHNDKEIINPTSEPENQISEQKKLKDIDGWKGMHTEARDKRKERDGDAEGERLEKRSREYDKESDEAGADMDGTGDRDSFGYAVQQRKRKLRQRGSSQVGNLDARFRSHNLDAEGFSLPITTNGNLGLGLIHQPIDLDVLLAESWSQGKPEVSTVLYKVGECMLELAKLWKEYEESLADKTDGSLQNGPTLEIRIPAEYVTATNRQVRGGQLWGTDVYTDDSDLVAVLMHKGYCRPTASPPPPAIQELRATIRVLPPQDCYVSTLRNNVRSRAWGAAVGCSYRVERCCIVKKGGGSIDLEPCLAHSSTVEPTLAPVAVERTMTTRAAASNALRQQRIKYSISIVADKGLKKHLYTSARLKKGEVLYLETHTRRYELCFTGEKMVKTPTASQAQETDTEKSHNHVAQSVNGDRTHAEGDAVMIDVFRWSRCKEPLPQKKMRSIGIPLPVEHLEVLEQNLDWEDVQWSQTGIWIAGKEYQLVRRLQLVKAHPNPSFR
ncbi:hypothetical protein AKJ16_DCAP21514 [Drosera capensis]